MANTDVIRAPLNRTLTLSDEEFASYRARLERLEIARNRRRSARQGFLSGRF